VDVWFDHAMGAEFFTINQCFLTFCCLFLSVPLTQVRDRQFTVNFICGRRRDWHFGIGTWCDDDDDDDDEFRESLFSLIQTITLHMLNDNLSPGTQVYLFFNYCFSFFPYLVISVFNVIYFAQCYIFCCSGMFRNVPCSWFYRRPLIACISQQVCVLWQLWWW